MASNTENLDLLMKNPSTDGADTFNVQTMLNENWQKIDNNAGTVAQTLANILKPTTPPIIGLPPSTTPDGMFQALGNTGELHVWRKTVVAKDPVPEVPGSYTLGSAKQLVVATRNNSVRDNASYIQSLQVGASVSVDLSGKVTIDSPSTQFLSVYSRSSDNTTPKSRDTVLGSGNKYFCVPKGATVYLLDLNVQYGEIYYIPDGATFTGCNNVYGGQGIFSSAQLVTGVPGTPAIPAGTTTTYPVSTNPNAYQEGDDAKPAGYTLGEVVTGTFQPLSYGSSITVYYASSVTVSDSGVLQDIPSTNYASIRLNNTPPSELKGKFIQIYSGDRENTNPPFNDGKIYYIPSNAVFATNTIDRYQPVTGYAAIPAGTTIEYLGKLGDKARVQVVSYVGTGTYGESNPNSLTFDFIPKLFWISGPGYAYYTDMLVFYGDTNRSEGNSDYYFTFNNISWEGKKVSWYSTSNTELQANIAGEKYTIRAIG